MSDESSNPRRSYFTLRELIALVLILGLGFAILVPFVQRSRRQAQRTGCSDNLRHLGRAFQNFHDIRREICPSYLTTDHTPAALPNGFASWAALSQPFYERPGMYDLFDWAVPIDRDAPLPANHAIGRMAMDPIWICPARRSYPPFPFVPGDYGNVSLALATDKAIRAEPRTWDAAMLPSRVFNASTQANTIPLNGFLPGTLGGREYRSLTTFASITDGVSYTIFLGEKGVHQDRLGKDTADLASAALPGYQDGTLLYGRGGNPADLIAPGDMAFWSRRLAPAKPGERLLPAKPRHEDPNNRFGGWHEGVTLFLLGDGQVKALSNDTSTAVLQRLGSRNDGQRVERGPQANSCHRLARWFVPLAATEDTRKDVPDATGLPSGDSRCRAGGIKYIQQRSRRPCSGTRDCGTTLAPINLPGPLAGPSALPPVLVPTDRGDFRNRPQGVV